MSTTKKVEAGSMLVVAALVLIVIAIGFGRVAGPSQANSPSYAPWSDPLTLQARTERAADAWAGRLTEMAKAEGKAPVKSPVVNERANKASAARLNGLAEYLATK